MSLLYFNVTNPYITHIKSVKKAAGLLAKIKCHLAAYDWSCGISEMPHPKIAEWALPLAFQALCQIRPNYQFQGQGVAQNAPLK